LLLRPVKNHLLRLTLFATTGLAFPVVLLVSAASAQTPETVNLFEQRCLTCHANSKIERAPDATVLRQFPPERIYEALTTGAMQVQAAQLTDEQKRSIAEYLGGRTLTDSRNADASSMPNHCAGNSHLQDSPGQPAWNGWGVDGTNGRFQTAGPAALSAKDVSGLKLKWAFGFPNAMAMWGQPAVVGGRVFIGVDTGYVYSLEAATGCVYWSFRAKAGVRNAISVGPAQDHGSSKYAAYFGDVRGNVYALDADTGALLWSSRVEEHALAAITGSPTLYQNRLYVPVSSREELAAISLSYPCCTFRGSVVALDSNNGRQIWKTYIIPDSPKPARKNSKGIQLWAPAGGAVWDAPTVDPKRHAVYVGTGNSYTESKARAIDAVLALDMNNGKMLWAAQSLKKDAWFVGCTSDSPSEDCPKDVGPDYDFGSSPILRALPDGRDILVAGQKGGVLFAYDPGRKGALLWKNTLVEELSLGEITFGGAADEQNAYFGLKRGGIAAVRLTTGKRVWFAPLPGKHIEGHGAGETAALTVIPGVVFSGGWDGVLRALSTEDGRLLWEFNTVPGIETVNGIAAHGGAMGAPGPTVVGGMVFVGSGYTLGAAGKTGNVLLAFSQ
jgi:polyvinyl alcohol dehydrogenase (cytochrome)